MRLGIDFGTTRTVVAVCDRGNYPVVAFETPDGGAVDWVPSVVATDGRRRVYGWDAVQKLREEGWTGRRSFKRLLGSGTDEVVRLGGTDVPLATVLTEYLASLRQSLLTRSNCPVALAEGARPHAMVAVPAGASSTQRFVMLEAFRAAGFKVVGILNEPSAAAIEYAHRFRSTLTTRRERVLVYDLGGGTFDASVVDLGEGGHRVLANAGLQDLGGDDFDRLLFDLATAEAGRPAIAPTHAQLEHCRQQKEGLNPSSRKVVVDLDDDTTVTLSTADYYAAAAPLVQRTLAAVAGVLPGSPAAPPTTEVTPHPAIDASELAGVYVVGGASDLPVVARILREVFGRRVRRSAYPSAATAVGLAIAQEGREQPLLEERFSRTFGVFRELRDGTEVGFDAILRDQLEIPAGGGQWVRRYRAAHNVGHFRFVECDQLDGLAPVGDIVPFGEIRFAFDPTLRDTDLREVEIQRADRPGPMVEERYTVDPAGMVQVRITDLDTGFSVEHRLGS